MGIDSLNKLIEKAKVKANGVYKSGESYYAVHNHNLIAYSDVWGECLAIHGNFTTLIDKVARNQCKKRLQEYLKNKY